MICRFIENGLNNFEKFVAGQGASDVSGAPAERKVLVGMIGAGELGLEVGEFLKEGIGTHSKAKTSRGASLDNAGQNKIKKNLKTTRNVDSIVMKEKGIKEEQKT